MNTARSVKAGTNISGQEAMEFSDLLQSLEFNFVLKQSDRQMIVEWYTIHMC